MTGSVFSYQAAHQDGRIERGRLSAASRDAAVGQLAARGLHPIRIEIDAGAGVRRRPSLPMAELALTLRLLADLVEAGLPIGRALHALETLAPPGFAAVLPHIRRSVREGRSLAQALGDSTIALPAEVLGIIQAGERGSGLAAAIRQAAGLCEETAAVGAAIRGALTYPLLLASAGVVSVGLLVGIVLPRFATILGDLGQALPPTTRLVLDAAALARASAGPALLAGAVGLVLWRTWTGTPGGRRSWHALLLATPLVGETRAAAASARICATLGALLQSGVPVAPALRSAAHATGDVELTARLLAARTEVAQGARLSAALAAHAAATPVVQRLVRAGEESGRLPSMLMHAAKLERERAARRVRGAVRLLEPALIIAFGGVIALVAAALLQALYSVRPGA
jgi:general secretion pathway protein F